MKVSAISGGYNSLNFGRALKPDEMEQAYESAKSVRELMGFKEGKGVLYIPSEKIPEPTAENSAKESISRFFEMAKKLLGINTVEISPEVTESTKSVVDEVLSAQGIKKVARFDFQTENLEEAIENAAKTYDGLRVVNPHQYSEDQLNLFAEIFEKVKGESFDPKLLMFQVDDQNSVYNWNNHKLFKKFDGKNIIGSSNYINGTKKDNLWGSTAFYIRRMNVDQGNFIHGIRKAGEPSLAQQIKDPGQVNQSIQFLENELKLQDEDFVHPARYAAAKRGEVVLSQNFYKHFDDLTPEITTDIMGFEKAYQEALEKGLGDNYFDSLAKAMKARGLNEGKGAQLYEQICKYRNALYSSGEGSAKTIQDALKLTAEQIEASYRDTKNVALQGFEVRQRAIQAIRDEEDRLKKLDEVLKNLNPLNEHFFDKAVNFARENKKALIFTGAIAAIAAVGGTMYSYGKEIATKSNAAKPQSEKLDKKA